MADPEGIVEIFLGPGDFYFGDHTTRIRTLLGSCVAITLWHPWERVGGMCHYMMPTRRFPAEHDHLDGRYADEALDLFMHELAITGTHPGDYQVKIFGGGSQFFGAVPAGTIDVPTANIHAGLDLLHHHGLPVAAMHLGGTGHRQVLLDIWNGHVWMRHVDLVPEVVGT